MKWEECNFIIKDEIMEHVYRNEKFYYCHLAKNEMCAKDKCIFMRHLDPKEVAQEILNTKIKED